MTNEEGTTAFDMKKLRPLATATAGFVGMDSETVHLLSSGLTAALDRVAELELQDKIRGRWASIFCTQRNRAQDRAVELERSLEIENAELRAQLATPMQPVVDVEGVYRFKANPIVRMLLDTHPSLDMNQLYILHHREPEMLSQFAQLIGYSVSGAGELNYVSDETIARADKACDELDRAKEGSK